ncbi:MAG: FAD-dependent oxidoreductase [Frankiaceae bacterium]
MEPALSLPGSYHGLLLRWDGLPSREPPPPPAGDLDVDVCSVGGGSTGLWTAAFAAALRGTVDEVGRFCAAEGVDAGFVKGGTLALARSAAQLARLRAVAAEEARWDREARWLPADEALAEIGASRVPGGAFTPHCAARNPARLVAGLALAVERRGVRIYERTTARRLAPGRVDTENGTVRAGVVVRATEGYTPRLAGEARTLLPVYSLMIATEPLPETFWSAVGWARRSTLTDGRHLLIYAQRTSDDRIAFGGRGAPYHFGSSIKAAYGREPAVFDLLRRALIELFPAARDAAITHRWGGPLGVPRDWFPSVGLDSGTGMAWAGGYVGDGVAASNLAGRTLTDLILRRDTELVRLPWVGHRSRRWEPEPVRWLAVNGMRTLVASADTAEHRTGRPDRRAALAARLSGPAHRLVSPGS